MLGSVRGVYIFKLGRYISALAHVGVLILSSYALLACIHKTDKYLSRLGDFVEMYMKLQFLGSGALYLRFKTS